jgi:hypothetical protein
MNMGNRDLTITQERTKYLFIGEGATLICVGSKEEIEQCQENTYLDIKMGKCSNQKIKINNMITQTSKVVNEFND